MKNKFIIDKVYAKENKIYYEYRVEGEEEFKKLFWLGDFFSVEFNENIEEVPESILVIPLVCNVLPIIWMNNGTIYLNKIDKTFYKAIFKIKEAYDEMLPNINLKGKVRCKRKIKNEYEPSELNATFFSGGVDSYSTLIRHLDEKPNLITIWGADVDFENEEGWNVVKSYIQGIGEKYNLKNVFIKTAVKRFVDNSELERQYEGILKDNWWHAMQHGIGLIGNIAPYAYKHRLNTIYVPSTYTKNDKNILCASRPEIDNNVKFGGTRVFHEGFDFNRQEKVNGITDYIKQQNDNIKLRVCYRSKKGDNCCKCEKCYRTIMAFISRKINPNNIGFEVDTNTIQEIKNKIEIEKMLEDKRTKPLWKDIQKEFKKEEEFWKENKDFKWFLELNID